MSMPTHNCKVVWVSAGVSHNVHEMYDRPRALCFWYRNQHMSDPQYAGGTLKVVSMMVDKTS